MTVAIPESVLRETAKWMVDFREYWHDELPQQIHSAELGEDGTPQWHPEFARWLGVDYRDGRSDRKWIEIERCDLVRRNLIRTPGDSGNDVAFKANLVP